MQISRRTDGLYRTHGADAEFLNKHPVPNSIIVESSQARTQAKSKPTLPNKDGRKVDMMAKKFTLFKPPYSEASVIKQLWALFSIIFGIKSFLSLNHLLNP